MPAKKDASRVSVPYVSFLTLKNFIGTLKETAAIPEDIDRSMMSNMSGGSQSHVLLSMRFLGLVTGPDDKKTAALQELVDAYGTDQWGSTLARIVNASYADIVNELDVETVSEQRLRKAFREHGEVEGSVLDRAVRFYVKALKDAGAKISPYLGKRKPRRANGPSRRGATKTTPRPSKSQTTLPPTNEPIGVRFVPVFLDGEREGRISFPENLKAEECDKFAAAVEYLRQLVK